jgi:hypothetical protein
VKQYIYIYIYIYIVLLLFGIFFKKIKKWLRPPLNCFFFFFNLRWGCFGRKKKVKIVELQKFVSLEECIAKFETLEVELKIV